MWRKRAKKREVNTDISYYQGLLPNPNIQAYLKTIRRGEGTLRSGYKTLVGGGKFNDFSHHPDIYKKQYNSTAAGAYQFIYKTWTKDAASLKLKDFSPDSQDIAALYEINKAHALDDVLNGNIEQAIQKTKGIWVSLPGAKHDKINKYSQKLTDALKFYENSGGKLSRTASEMTNNGLLSTDQPVQAEDLLQKYKPPIAIADHNRVADPTNVAIVKMQQRASRENKENNSGANLYNINALLDMQEWIKAGVEMPEIATKNLVPPEQVNSKKIINKKNSIGLPIKINRVIPDLRKAENNLQPPVISKEQIMKNIFMNHPKIKSGLYDRGDAQEGLSNASNAFPMNNPSCTNGMYEAQNAFKTPDFGNVEDSNGVSENGNETRPSLFSDAKVGNNGVSKYYGKDATIDDSSAAKVVNINLNTPIIGNFTISTKDTGAGLNDLKHQVEDVILEILNSANAIQ